VKRELGKERGNQSHGRRRRVGEEMRKTEKEKNKPPKPSQGLLKM
jgi:hypothetical protein